MWNNNKEIDLLEILNKALIVFRRTWFLLILLLAITVGAAGVYVKFSYVAVYYDKVTFSVTREQMENRIISTIRKLQMNWLFHFHPSCQAMS